MEKCNSCEEGTSTELKFFIRAFELPSETHKNHFVLLLFDVFEQPEIIL